MGAGAVAVVLLGAVIVKKVRTDTADRCLPLCHSLTSQRELELALLVWG